ncbi:COX15/CtaA family protein [Nocardioides sp. BP30]|uniref:COX15/CtaA family protein n=1 Tax=Nocardioides sp. BP30 TaxID=3036374 RepID=UPI0024686180|nr:COX15/CtaA family protein [Nocardioides sp. BP30]WGL50887.1 COX15/CtaA family protein [Nocardioides sp. BP30]
MGVISTARATPDTRRPGRVRSWLRGHLVPLAVANLCANILLVVTGGVVRLTSSGLGCPTWPECTDGSYVRHGATGIHGVIEFSNRMLTYVLTAIAIAVVVAAWDRVGKVRRLAVGIALGIPLQAVIGGISVLTDLNPWVVALHLLASMAMISLCVWMLDTLWSPARGAAPRRVAGLSWAVFALGWVVLWLGTIVTGSGPHSGDLQSKRTGLDPATMSHLHALAVDLLVALTVTLLVVVRRSPYLRLVVGVLLGVELAQGIVGWIQYETGLPAFVVGLHMLGAALTAAGLARVVLSTRPHTR